MKSDPGRAAKPCAAESSLTIYWRGARIHGESKRVRSKSQVQEGQEVQERSKRVRPESGFYGQFFSPAPVYAFPDNLGTTD